MAEGEGGAAPAPQASSYGEVKEKSPAGNFIKFSTLCVPLCSAQRAALLPRVPSASLAPPVSCALTERARALPCLPPSTLTPTPSGLARAPSRWCTAART
jgi:hypothetical protein